jgi:hypothetical protein
VLSGKVRCGLCGKVAGVHYNERSQATYRCRHRGKGREQPGRSPNGLHRAAVLGLRVMAADTELQQAIRDQLGEHRAVNPSRGPSTASVIASLKTKERKLLDLFYADKIDADGFAVEQQRLKAQITSLETEIAIFERDQRERDAAANRFDAVAELLRRLDIDRIWTSANPSEQRILVEDLLDSIKIFPDQLTVQVSGAPPILVTLQEAGLRGGIKPMVSESRRAQSPSGG